MYKVSVIGYSTEIPLWFKNVLIIAKLQYSLLATDKVVTELTGCIEMRWDFENRTEYGVYAHFIFDSEESYLINVLKYS